LKQSAAGIQTIQEKAVKNMREKDEKRKEKM
jgi:hypothetical protein